MPEGFRIASAWVEVEPNLEGFEEKLKAALDKATAGAHAEAWVDLDTAAFDAKLDDARAHLDELSGSRAEPTLRLNSEELAASADEARAKLNELDARSARPDVGLESGDLNARVDEARAKLDELDAKSASARLDLNTADFDAKLDRAEARLDAFRAKSASASLGASGGGGGEGGGLLGMVPGGGMGLLAGAASSLLPGVGGAATGLGLLGGAGFLGLGGIGKALGAADQARNAPGILPQQQALTNFTNQVAIQQAQANLASVQRNAAEQQVQALQGVKQAEQGVEEANYSLSEAQYNLNQAWESARENLRQLNDQLADQRLSVQQAKLAVQEAEYQQKLVDENAYSTALQRQQAALSVAQAQQQVKDAEDQLTATTYKANLANKEGVAGSQQVIQAKQAMTQAQYGQQNAQFAYANSQRQLTLTELNNAQQVRQAQLAITNTLREQQLQQAATAASANQAANQFAQDMAKLTPAARSVVNQILGMQGAFKGLEVAAQNGIAPGVSVFLKGLQASMPAITSGIGRMAQVLGGVFAHIGQALQSPAGAKVLQGLIDNGIRFAQIVIPAIGRFVGALAEVGSKKGAVDGLANLLGGIADGMASLVNGLSPFVGALSSMWTTLGKALSPIGQLIGTVVGSLAKALAPALQALLPGLQALTSALGQGLATALSAIGPMLQPVGEAVTVVVEAFAPLLPIIGQLIGKVAQALTPVLQAMVPVIQQLAELIAQHMATGLQQMLSAIMPILPALGQLVISLMPVISKVLEAVGAAMTFQDKIMGPVTAAIAWLITKILDLASHWQVVTNAIGTAANWLWNNVLKPSWQAIEAGATWLYQNAILPLGNAFKTAFGMIETDALWLWHNILDPMWHGIEQGANAFISAFQTAWNGLETIFKTPVNFLIDVVYKNGIEDLWNKVVGAVGASSLKLPDIPHLAAGGVLPGYAPGQDTVPAMLSPGEGILVPEAVQALGPGTVNALNAQFGRGRTSIGGHFSGGGIIGGIGGIVGGLISGGGDVVKIASAILTGNSTALSNALDHLVGTNAVGNFGKMMLDIPTKLISTAVHALMSFFSGGGGNGGGVSVPGHPSGTVAQWYAQGIQAAGVPASWLSDLETIGWYESGWNPNAINLTDSNAAAGDPSRGIMQEIMTTFLAHHVPGTSMNIYDPVANIASASRYIQGRYGDVSNVPGIRSLARGGGYVGYDSGGLAYGIGMLPKYTPSPERVLSPRQTEAFERLVAILDRQSGNGGSVGRDVQVVQNYYGTQFPTPEMQAQQRRELALALSGA